MDHCPKRIVCLTEETTETLYLLGEEERIVGISGFTVRPKGVRQEKQIVSTFTHASYEEIIALSPDLVIGFSDIQAEIAEKLIRRGITVWINNYRSISGIYQMIYQLGSLVGKSKEANALISGYQSKIEHIQSEVKQWSVQPKVYFEEWYDPIISGIKWVSEIVQICGGIDLFHHLSEESLAKDRIIKDAQEVVDSNPDIVLVSWCGKMFKPKRMFERFHWKSIKAFQTDDYYEIPSSVILQPGPAALSDGIDQIHGIFKQWVLKQQT
ncbi:MAG: cobalamin-binding protein [Verrucomicrobia bacterium]|nr:cobalamin-binding protein [Verrucomicrobiota bacterium]|tara:strand:+ start:491 stop:1294 length:804 start_codon:yes stop_codon:yes gene_type:complete